MKLGHVGSYVFNGTLPALGNLDFAAHGNDMETRPHQITEDEEKEAEKEAGKQLSRAERRKLARQKRKPDADSSLLPAQALDKIL